MIIPEAGAHLFHEYLVIDEFFKTILAHMLIQEELLSVSGERNMH